MAEMRGEPVMFNPLYIHAGVGLGKTHLLQATTWAGNNGTERKVLYLTAEKFMYGFVSALRTQTALAFKEALRAIDTAMSGTVRALMTPRAAQISRSILWNSMALLYR